MVRFSRINVAFVLNNFFLYYFTLFTELICAVTVKENVEVPNNGEKLYGCIAKRISSSNAKEWFEYKESCHEIIDNDFSLNQKLSFGILFLYLRN